MLLTIPDAAIVNAVYDATAMCGPLHGRVLDDGDVVQVWGLDATAGTYLGRWAIGALQSLDRLPTHAPAPGEILVLIHARSELHISAYQYREQSWQEIPTQIIRPYADYAVRLQGLFEVDRLTERRVAIVGLGTGGGVVATQLARCGVGHMRLVDFDRLEVHNIARHVCGLGDIGRYKTRAVSDLLGSISPIVQTETFEFDVTDDAQRLATVIEDCDLVVAATDSERSKLAVNQAAWPRGIPVVYGAAYNRAFGGDVFRAAPPGEPCYECFHAAASELFETAPIAANDFTPAYADPSRLPDMVAEPGLGMDVGMIALLMARVALVTLLRDGETTMPELPANWVLFGNRAEWVFEYPLQSLFIDIPKRTDCPICNRANDAQQLGMTEQEIEEAAKRIVEESPAIETMRRSTEAYR